MPDKVRDQALDDEALMNLVETALMRPPGDREAFLQTTCTDDPELLAQAWRYIHAEERMNGFLLEPLFSLTAEREFLPSGEVLDGRFRILREIGEGGMGVVYEAFDEKLERRIAVKCAKPGFHKRLPPEVRNASTISHPNVCKVFEIHNAPSSAGEIDFVTMELLEGRTLSDRLRQGLLPQPEAARIARQLCAGLAAAHEAGIVHGDLKSNNVVLVKADGQTRAIITDFGLAGQSVADPAVRQASTIRAGAPDYMAPELLKGGKPSVASDVYALGVILYELAAGRLPFNHATAREERLTKHPAALHHRWGRVIAKCLDPDPARRFRSAAEVGRALGPSRIRSRVLAVAAAAALAAVSGTVVYQQATAPPTVRLAVLPFESDASSKALAEGVLLDASNRLNHLKSGRTRLTLIPLSDAMENKVSEPANAGRTLGAAYTLSGSLRQESGLVRIRAYITDTHSLVRMKEWQADYAANELDSAPVALAGIVTGTLRLPPLAIAPVVKPEAYRDWAEGVSLAQREDTVDRAIPLLMKAVEIDPGSPLTQAKLAAAEWLKFRRTSNQEWADLALTSLKNAELRNPDAVPVRMVAGLIRDYFGDYPRAQEDLTRATEIEPLNGDAWRQLGRVYEHSHQPSRALEAYLRAIDVQPQYFKNHRELASFYFNQGDYENAIVHAKKTIDLAPDLAAAHYALAAPYLNLGRYSDAERELLIARRFQETANVTVGLGLVYMYQGRDRDAIPYFQRAIEIGPAQSVYFVNLGTVLRRAGFEGGSRDAYGKARALALMQLEENPANAYERAILAYVSARLGDSERARAEAAQAAMTSMESNDVRWMLSLTYEALNQREQTIKVLQNAPGALLNRVSRFPDLADLSADSRFRQLMESGSNRVR